MHYLWVHTSYPNALTLKKTITKLDDLKGTKNWSPGAIGAKCMAAIGATAVSLPIGDIYTSLQTGVLDGVVIDYTQLVNRKFAELAKYSVFFTSCESTYFIVVMNTNTWNKLPPDIQKIINDESGPVMVDTEAKAVDAEALRCKQVCIDQYGVKMVDLTAAEQDKVTEGRTAITTEWIKDVDAKGLPGTAVYNELVKFAKEYKP